MAQSAKMLFHTYTTVIGLFVFIKIQSSPSGLGHASIINVCHHGLRNFHHSARFQMA